jgi:hypothetical protein
MSRERAAATVFLANDAGVADEALPPRRAFLGDGDIAPALVDWFGTRQSGAFAERNSNLAGAVTAFGNSK